MAEIMDLKGLKCPQPVLKLAIAAKKHPAGTTIEVLADCNTFPEDVKKWCNDSGKVLVSCVDKGGYFSATVQL